MRKELPWNLQVAGISNSWGWYFNNNINNNNNNYNNNKGENKINGVINGGLESPCGLNISRDPCLALFPTQNLFYSYNQCQIMQPRICVLACAFTRARMCVCETEAVARVRERVMVARLCVRLICISRCFPLQNSSSGSDGVNFQA